MPSRRRAISVASESEAEAARPISRRPTRSTSTRQATEQTTTPQKRQPWVLPSPPSSRRGASRSAEVDDTPTKSKRRAATAAARQMLQADLDGDSSADEMMLRPTPPRKKRKIDQPLPTPRTTPRRQGLRSSSVAPLDADIVSVVPDSEAEVVQSDNEEILEVAIKVEPAAEEEVVRAIVASKPRATTTPRSSPKKTPKSKRKAVVLERAEDASDEEVVNDENAPLILPHDLLDQRTELQPHQRAFDAKHALPLLQSVLDVVHGRVQPPALAGGAVDTRLALASQPCLPTLEEYELDVRAQLDRTVRDGEGNCMLLLGPPGVGKTAIIERSLHLLEQAHGADAFITIRISGSVTTTDRGTLREIARQLCTDETAGIDDDGSSFTSHSVILQSLLALLEPESSTAGPSDTLDRSKPLIFVLDDFDRFAERDDRQSFLYCLVDIVQSRRRKGGMAVVGVSKRVDCLDRLEKRVRSRCQSRVLRVLPPATFADWLRIARVTLTCAPAKGPARAVREAWNTDVEAFLDDSDAQRALRDLYDLRGCTAELLQNLGSMLCVHAHATIKTKRLALPCLQASDLPLDRTTIERFPLSALPIVCLAVLVAAKHATTSSPKPFITPAAIQHRYKLHADHNDVAKHVHQRFSPRAVARAIEVLLDLGALVDAPGVSANAVQASATSAFRRLRLAVWTSDLDLALKKRGDVPATLKQWCARG